MYEVKLSYLMITIRKRRIIRDDINARALMKSSFSSFMFSLSSVSIVIKSPFVVMLKYFILVLN